MRYQVPTRANHARDGEQPPDDSSDNETAVLAKYSLQPRAKLTTDEPAQGTTQEKADHVQHRRRDEKLDVFSDDRGRDAEGEQPTDAGNHRRDESGEIGFSDGRSAGHGSRNKGAAS